MLQKGVTERCIESYLFSERLLYLTCQLKVNSFLLLSQIGSIGAFSTQELKRALVGRLKGHPIIRHLFAFIPERHSAIVNFFFAKSTLRSTNFTMVYGSFLQPFRLQRQICLVSENINFTFQSLESAKINKMVQYQVGL